ncbi:MAG: hypothetical protein FRX49_00669 [Trebouxia sp. A1-2]|nr:MAG: hypothetical protein FRX49_00669 [Trebouxia sp. A1-2]
MNTDDEDQGRPNEYISFRHTDLNVQKDQYDSCTYCQQCSFPKPPQAHHCRPPAATTASQPVVLLWDMLINTDKADWMQLQSGWLSPSGSGVDVDCICCTDCTSQSGKGWPQAESAS